MQISFPAIAFPPAAVLPALPASPLVTGFSAQLQTSIATLPDISDAAPVPPVPPSVVNPGRLLSLSANGRKGNPLLPAINLIPDAAKGLLPLTPTLPNREETRAQSERGGGASKQSGETESPAAPPQISSQSTNAASSDSSVRLPDQSELLEAVTPVIRTSVPRTTLSFAAAIQPRQQAARNTQSTPAPAPSSSETPESSAPARSETHGVDVSPTTVPPPVTSQASTIAAPQIGKRTQRDSRDSEPTDVQTPSSAASAPLRPELAGRDSTPVTHFAAFVARPEAMPPAAPKEIESPVIAQAEKSAGPMKDLSFRIAQPNGPSVQLHVAEHGGELRVSVHAANGDLNQGLRDSLPELTRKLSDNGFRAETWRPADPSAAPAESTATKDQSGNSSGDNSQSQSGGSQQDRGQGQNNQKKSHRPAWVDELENRMQTAPSSTGDHYGFRS